MQNPLLNANLWFYASFILFVGAVLIFLASQILYGSFAFLNTATPLFMPFWATCAACVSAMAIVTVIEDYLKPQTSENKPQ